MDLVDIDKLIDELESTNGALNSSNNNHLAKGRKLLKNNEIEPLIDQGYFLNSLC